ncbi:MSMEG_4193 family putative phosphomutase [Dermacoccus nishinomiyaensis]|uniref:MSMEG_4193 family putative phosphomutase n=1 Tax=Dermacoccus nishinomiyaensis TaxID=1274 RepID=UPI0011A2C9D1|nr:MSMEG_4193 family putative phosphomutase [Dermacoccus nishinomiyaensis]
MATIILLRHGRTSANASGVLAGWSPDVHLDELGRAQADAAAAAISACCTPERIVASPLVRCQETADALRAASGAAVETDDAVGECRYGAWTGRKLSDLAGEELWKQVQEHPSQVTFPPSPQFEHESMLAMQRRAVDAVRALARELDERSSDEQGGSGVGVVVSHGDVIKSMLSDALGQHLDDFQRIVLAPASMSVIRFVGDRPFVLAMNVTSGGLGEAVGLARSTSAESTVGGATGATQ